MIGDGMGWEMSRASAIQAEIEREIAQIRLESPDITNEELAARFRGRTLDDYYTAGKGTGTSYQDLEHYAISTTGNTYIAGSKTNSALQNNPQIRQPQTFYHNTGQARVREGFEFDPSPAVVQGFQDRVGERTEIPQPRPLNGGFNEAPVVDASGRLIGGNVSIFDLVSGGATPWDDNYYKNRDNIAEGFNPNYIKNLYPDSAGTATGMYTGVKTYVGAVAVDIYEETVTTAAEAAQNNGKSVGVVSSVPFNHATPGAAIAHANHRNKYNDLSFDRTVGNRDGDSSNERDEFGHRIEPWDNIYYQIVNESKPDVILGGGHYLTDGGTEARPNEKYITKAEVKKLRNGDYDYTFIERGRDASQVLANTAKQINLESGDRLFGLYGARQQGGNLPWRTANDDYSRTGHNLTSDRLTGKLQLEPPQLLAGESVKDFIAREVNENPTLKELTQAALKVLEQDDDGFWLTVEGGDIDWAAHGNDMDNLLGTMKDFDESVAAVRDWMQNNGGYEENLLIVTADHDHYLTLKDNFPEQLAKALLTESAGTRLTTNSDPSATAHFWGSNARIKNGWRTHTARPVPVYYQGADAEIIDALKGSSYEAYGKEVVGVSDFIDQTHLGTAQIEILNNPQQANTSEPLGFSWQFGLVLILLFSLGLKVLNKSRTANWLKTLIREIRSLF